MLTVEALHEARAIRYRQRPHLRVHNETEALQFLNDVGLCLLFSAKDLELPTLWGAICGDNRPLPGTNRDRNLGLAWDWKDRLPVAGKVLYGKFLRKKPVFVSLELAPHFYALSPNYGNLAEDYVQDYADGRLSVEAKQVYEVLLDQGALATSRLRREAGLAGKANAGRFDRALAELQMDFRIAKVSISDANRWGYCYVYDLLPRHFTQIVEASRDIGGSEARETILLRYLRTVVAATPQQVARLFDWQPGDVERLVAHLGAQGCLQSGVQIAGLAGEHLVSVEA
ncbi:MAG TPA: crosslink repair DNA glycosylase YcaQ family protein [Anaerolineae bacterium]|nr:crosslink repair DNA glycosylase YcaQ family protein [Anaerolineae bacterium]